MIVCIPPTYPRRSKILKTYLEAITPFRALSIVKIKRVLLYFDVLYLKFRLYDPISKYSSYFP